jgi:hypothetical protein
LSPKRSLLPSQPVFPVESAELLMTFVQAKTLA